MVGWMRCMVDWHMDSCGGRERRGQSSRPAVTDWSSIDSIRCKTPNQTNRHSGRARDESGRGEGGGRERGKGGDVVGDSITFHYTCLRPPPWRPPSCTHTMSHRDVMHCRAASRAVCVCVSVHSHMHFGFVSKPSAQLSRNEMTVSLSVHL